MIYKNKLKALLIKHAKLLIWLNEHQYYLLLLKKIEHITTQKLVKMNASDVDYQTM